MSPLGDDATTHGDRPVDLPDDGRMSLHDRFELEVEGRTAVLATTGWQRVASLLAWLCIAANGLLAVLGTEPRGLLRIVTVVLSVVGVGVLLVISFAPPPLGARVVGIRDMGPDLAELVSSTVSTVTRRVSRRE